VSGVPTYRLRSEEVEVSEERVAVFRWRCRFCGRLFESLSAVDTLRRARLHLRNKHGLNVVVEGGRRPG